MTFGLLKKSWGKSHHLRQLHVTNKRLFTTKMISSDESGKTDIEVEDEDNDWTSLPEFISTSDQVNRSIETTIRREQLRDQRRELRFLSIKTKAKKQVASKKQRNVEMWNRLTEEEKLTQKLLRQQRQELSENRLKHAMISGINVCVELAFDEENSEKERKSLWKQLSLTYGILKKAQVFNLFKDFFFRVHKPECILMRSAPLCLCRHHVTFMLLPTSSHRRYLASDSYYILAAPARLYPSIHVWNGVFNFVKINSRLDGACSHRVC